MVPWAGAALQVKVLIAYIAHVGEARHCVCEHRGSSETDPWRGVSA